MLIRPTILPWWLALSLLASFVFSGVIVSALAFLTMEAVLSQPINPIAIAAQEVADISLPPMMQEGVVQPPTLEANAPTPTPIPTAEPIADLNPERVTILLMGLDRRPGEPFVARTDTMLLISIDPVNNTVAILSVPRDLYVVIPGRGRERINTAFVYGSIAGNTAGGAELAMQTVEYNLGVEVDHYAIVDFATVISLVDAIGGVDVDVPVAIWDPLYPDMNYGYDPLSIAAGPQHFDGLLALKYARTRHQDSDIGRAQRQQQMILAVRNQILSLGVTDLVRRAPGMYSQVEEGFYTDMSLGRLIQLGHAASKIPSENIHTAVLDYQYVTTYITETGASVLLMNSERTSTLIADLFYE